MRKKRKHKRKAKLLEKIEYIWREYKNDEILYKKIKDFLKSKEKDDILSTIHWYESELKSAEVAPWILTVVGFLFSIFIGYFKEILIIGVVDGVTQYHLIYHIAMSAFYVVLVVELIMLILLSTYIKKLKYLIEVLNDILSSRK